MGASVATLDPILEAIQPHVFAAERLHVDDTTVPVLAKLKTVTGRIWTYVRDDRPFGGKDPPAVLFYYSRTRSGEYPRAHLAGWTGVMQADAFAGFNELYEARRQPAPIIEAACWSHGRRKFFDLAKLTKAPIACEAVRRIDELFEIERSINGCQPEWRLAMRQEQSKPLVVALEAWLRGQRERLSGKSEIAKAINYSLNRWPSFTRFLDDGRICLSNNAAERAVRGVAFGRANWTFAGSDAGGHRAAAVYTLIETCKLNDVDPQAWLAYVLASSPIIPRSGSTNCCRGIGRQAAFKSKLQMRLEAPQQLSCPMPAVFAKCIRHHRASCTSCSDIGRVVFGRCGHALAHGCRIARRYACPHCVCCVFGLPRSSGCDWGENRRCKRSAGHSPRDILGSVGDGSYRRNRESFRHGCLKIGTAQKLWNKASQ